MEIYRAQQFSRWYDDSSSRTFADMAFEDCSFSNCGISITRDPRLRSTAQNISFTNCRVDGMFIHSAVVEDVLVDGLATGRSNGFLLQCLGTVFRHVIFRGKIGKIMLSSFIGPSASDREQAAFDAANARYYAATDWAVDIREADFMECDMRGVPAALVRRDPKTQVVVNRQNALSGHWRDLPALDSRWVAAIELFLRRESKDVVLVAPRQHADFGRLRIGLQILRDVGVANAD